MCAVLEEVLDGDAGLVQAAPITTKTETRIGVSFSRGALNDVRVQTPVGTAATAPGRVGKQPRMIHRQKTEHQDSLFEN